MYKCHFQVRVLPACLAEEHRICVPDLHAGRGAYLLATVTMVVMGVDDVTFLLCDVISAHQPDKTAVLARFEKFVFTWKKEENGKVQA